MGVARPIDRVFEWLDKPMTTLTRRPIPVEPRLNRRDRLLELVKPRRTSVASDRPLLVPCGLEGFDYQIDPYIGCGHYCRYCYVLNQAETDWTEEILVYADIDGQLDRELDGLPTQTIYMGYHTDPYQPCEAELQQTRNVLRLLQGKGFSASILTKSNLVLRDIDLLREMESPQISVSVAFDDDQIRGLFEVNTLETHQRIEALRGIRNAGISTGALICPVIPYITNVRQLLDALLECADVIWVYGLSVQSRTELSWRNVQATLETHFPDQRELVEEVVLDSDHPYWSGVRAELEEVRSASAADLRIHV